MFQRLWEDVITKNGGQSEWQPKVGPTGYLDQESEMPKGPAFIAGTLPSPDGRKWVLFEIEEDNGTKIPCLIHDRYNNKIQPKVMALYGLYNFPNDGYPIVKYNTVAGEKIKILIDGGEILSNKGNKMSLNEEGKNFWKSTNKSVDDLNSIIKAQKAEIERLQKLVRQNRNSSISEKKSKELTVEVSKKKEELSWPPNENYFKSLASSGLEHLEKNGLDNITVLTYFKNDPNLLIFDPNESILANTQYITKEFTNTDKTKTVVVMVGEID